MPFIALVDTRNSDGDITDSAAGATAYSTGFRSYNGAVGVHPSCREMVEADSAAVMADPASCAPRTTLAERSEAAGKSSGLITTTWVSDATPASFAVHSPSRYLQPSITRQLLASGVDVLMGGGRAVFDGTSERAEGDILTDACLQTDCPADLADLRALPTRDRRLIGLFAPGEMPPAGERTPDLPTMTAVALERLSMNPEGFFLLVETEGTDSYQHANLPIEAIRNEIVEFDRAIELALDFARENPETLVVVTADHETGGLALERKDGSWLIDYTTGGHTNAMVPLFAVGPGAERLTGVLDNDEVGRILASIFAGAEF